MKKDRNANLKLTGHVDRKSSTRKELISLSKMDGEMITRKEKLLFPKGISKTIEHKLSPGSTLRCHDS